MRRAHTGFGLNRLRGFNYKAVLWILTLGLALNFYLTLSNLNGRAQIGFATDGEEAIRFAKTFIFWTPDFSKGHCGDSAASKKSFHQRLKKKFGGWTRWRVFGDGPEGEIENGWFYQVSLAKGSDPLTLTEITTMLKDCFREHSYYLTEIPHR